MAKFHTVCNYKITFVNYTKRTYKFKSLFYFVLKIYSKRCTVSKDSDIKIQIRSTLKGTVISSNTHLRLQIPSNAT